MTRQIYYNKERRTRKSLDRLIINYTEITTKQGREYKEFYKNQILSIISECDMSGYNIEPQKEKFNKILGVRE